MPSTNQRIRPAPASTLATPSYRTATQSSVRENWLDGIGDEAPFEGDRNLLLSAEKDRRPDKTFHLFSGHGLSASSIMAMAYRPELSAG